MPVWSVTPPEADYQLKPDNSPDQRNRPIQVVEAAAGSLPLVVAVRPADACLTASSGRTRLRCGWPASGTLQSPNGGGAFTTAPASLSGNGGIPTKGRNWLMHPVHNNRNTPLLRHPPITGQAVGDREPVRTPTHCIGRRSQAKSYTTRCFDAYSPRTCRSCAGTDADASRFSSVSGAWLRSTPDLRKDRRAAGRTGRPGHARDRRHRHRCVDWRQVAGSHIGLRTDMDALPMEEKTHLSYASHNPGTFHGCGHDGHMSMLLGAACI